MKCPRCGKRILSTDRICKHCGKRLPRQKNGAKSQISPRAQLRTNKLLMAGIVGVLIIIAFMLVIIPGGDKKGARIKLGRSGKEVRIERGKTSREIASHAVYGKVMASHIKTTRRGTITVKSLHTGKVYTFYVGWHTSYHPQRYPSIGERVKVYHLNDEVSLKATQVTIEQ
jgi:hypothetical protein